jgi:hypothetical protein
MSRRRSSRRTALHGVGLLGTVALAGCLGGDELPTATPAGESDGIDFFVRNSFVKNDDSGNKVDANVRIAVRAVDESGDIGTVYESSFRIEPETTRMIADTFVVDDAMQEYVVNVETVPVLDASRANRAQHRFEPGSSAVPEENLITVNVSNAPDRQPGPEANYQQVSLDT